MKKSIFRTTLIFSGIALVVFSVFISVHPFVIAAPNEKKIPSHRSKASLIQLRRLKEVMNAVEPLHQEMGEPRAGDWLKAFPEKGQTFAEYQRCKPTLPRGERRIVYVQPLGEFSATQREIVASVAEYLEGFYGLSVRLEPVKPLPDLPENARRIHPTWKTPQIRSTYLLSDFLRPTLPHDAAALIAFTTDDLFPNEKMNFVFGQASLQHRVGVWSLHRLGDPDVSEEDYRLCLIRTMKIATHETGHMFSFKHCTKYECNMSGSNSLSETDRRTLDACPECMAKICWGMNYDPLERYQKLADFCKTHELIDEQEFFEAAIDRVSAINSR